MPDREPEAGVPIERVGIVLVHGIGEQGRFEHLDWQLRDLAQALHGLQLRGCVERVTVEISGSGAATFHAVQDTWVSGPEASVTIVVRHRLGGTPHETRLMVHEVWWADVNEPYSLAKQVRFWWWGLAVWSLPEKLRSRLGTSYLVAPPVLPRRTGWLAKFHVKDRLRLFGVGAFFVLAGYSIGTLTVIANRLLNWRTPDMLRVLANYISAVKLYNQQLRFGPGLWWQREDFLDSIGEPPRVSIRRRMIRTIADVAANRYERWYVMAHSQGSVVTFNGLMETSYAWPGYLDEERWRRLERKGMTGQWPEDRTIPVDIVPRRPAWSRPRDIVDRAAIFSRFRGFLTFGSPLEIFAGIWPARVPVSLEPAFSPDTPWLNVYDPIDPISGQLLAFGGHPAECCPTPVNLGYAASWWLLLAHLKYLTRRKGGQDMATAVMEWFLSDDSARVPRGWTGWTLGRWFTVSPGRPGKARTRRVRTLFAWGSWFAITAILLVLGAIFLPMILHTAGAAILLLGRKVADFAPWLDRPLHGLRDWLEVPLGWIARRGQSFKGRCLLLAIAAVTSTFVVGVIARLFMFRRDDDDADIGTAMRGRRRPEAIRRRSLGI